MDNIEILNYSLNRIIDIYLNEFLDYIDPQRIKYLNDKNNIQNVIKFSENGFGAWCNGLNIMFGSNTPFLIEKLIKRNSNHGINPEIELVTPEEAVNNEKDYIDYIKYFTIKGCNELDYYLDMLPHETMHLIGIGGGVFPEGVAESRAREVCLKYGIRIAPVLHSKETKLVTLLDEIVGKDVMNRMGFNDTKDKYAELQTTLDKRCGVGTFKKIFLNTEPAYSKIYVNGEYNNQIDRFIAYREKLDFSVAYDLLNKKIKEKNQIDV